MLEYSLPNFEPAEIIRPLGRPLPESVRDRMKAYYVQNGQTRLRVTFAHAAQQDPRGTFIISPGRTEFSEKYFDIMGEFLTRGFSVICIDPRGQGLSDRLLDDPLKSYVEDFQDYADDIAQVISKLSPILPKPHIIFGHSMGGCIALHGALSGALSPAAMICSAPMLGLYDIDTAPIKLFMRIFSKFGLKKNRIPFQASRGGLPLPLKGNKLTSDATRYNHWASYFQTEPRLRVNDITFGWVRAALKSIDYVNNNAKHLKTPTLIFAAGADPIVTPRSNESFAKSAGADYFCIPGALHELYMEQDIHRNIFLGKIDAYLKAQGL